MSRIQKIKQYIEKHAGVKTPREMAEDMDVSRSYIACVASMFKICIKKKDHFEKLQKLQELFENRDPHETPNAIAKKAGVAHVTAYKLFRKNNVGWEFRKKEEKPIMTGKFFNETEMENWLIN